MAQILVHSVLSMKYNRMTKDNSFWSQFCFGHLSLALPLIHQFLMQFVGLSIVAST